MPVERAEVERLFTQPLKELIAEAARIHVNHFPANAVQLSTLLSIKTGGCSENCSYCPQSAHYQTGVPRQRLLPLEQVKAAALAAQAHGATRFCMGAAWREVKDGPDFEQVLAMVREVNGLGLEVCCTLGMLNARQADQLKAAGLYAYNHNLDSSRDFYARIVSTRTYDDRLRTLQNARQAGLTVCTGGIIGMGESEVDRVDFLCQLASFDPHPESVTINALIPVDGTPLGQRHPPTPLELARVIATARCLMPQAMIRLSAGRKGMSEEGQFLCILAGANSIFLGETLLTSGNPSLRDDRNFMLKTGLQPMVPPA